MEIGSVLEAASQVRPWRQGLLHAVLVIQLCSGNCADNTNWGEKTKMLQIQTPAYLFLPDFGENSRKQKTVAALTRKHSDNQKKVIMHAHIRPPHIKVAIW